MFGGILRPAVLGTALHLVSGFPSRRGQRRLVLIPIKPLLAGSLWAIHIVFCIETICIHDVWGTLELLLQGPGMAIAEPKKNNRHLPGEENAAFIARFLCQICRLLNSTMLCPLVIQRLTFNRFPFSDFIHLLRVLGISWLSYITSRIHSALLA